MIKLLGRTRETVKYKWRPFDKRSRQPETIWRCIPGSSWPLKRKIHAELAVTAKRHLNSWEDSPKRTTEEVVDLIDRTIERLKEQEACA